MNIEQELFKLQDLKYRNFTSKLLPNIDKNSIIGVKTPLIRNFANKVSDEDALNFLNALPHKYQEENLLHGFLMNLYIKNLTTYLDYLTKFLPYINNWAVCDVISPKIFRKNFKEVHSYLVKLLKSNKIYTLRFAIVSLLQFYLDNNFNKKDLELIRKIKSDEYYVNMAIAWYYSFALIKQYDNTIYLFKNKLLNKWVHNKSIQKAIESFRITNEKKEYLKSLKIK